jgi:hypothetical protein
MIPLLTVTALFIGLGSAAYGLGYGSAWVFGLFKVTAISLD